ncbi:GH36-type glycosyl hydrolase domain-containing protein [Desulfocurvus sp. DL9XJH121]
MAFKHFAFTAGAQKAQHPGPETGLLRSELLSIKQLEIHAAALAGMHKIDPTPGQDKLLSRLADNERVLLAAYGVVTGEATPGQRILPAEAWLLDNFYLIEQQISLARRHLPRGYSRRLPRLAEGPSAGFPRIYDLALELISHMDGRVDNENATRIVASYQSVEPLTLGELWAFPIMLQLALLENLRRVGKRIANQRKEREAAILWADRMLSTADNDPKQLILLLAKFADADVPLTAPFVEEFYARLQTQADVMAFIETWIEQKLREQGVTAEQLSAVAGRTAAANQISIANSIGSLRFIGAMDWKDFVESLSVVERILSDDPAGLHTAQDFTTRNRYRNVIEDLARGISRSESAVAHAAIALAQTAAERSDAGDRSMHVGFYLVETGRDLLERALGYHLPWLTRMRRAGRRFCLTLYLGPILILTALATWMTLLPLGRLGISDWRYWLFAAIGALCASSVAVALVNLAATLLLPPRVIPRLDFSNGIPSAHRTMVVVPTLLNKQDEVDDLIEALEIRYLGNRDQNVFFALLTDFHDAPERSMPGDDALLDRARAGIRGLNDKHPETHPFYLFHRPRTWNACQRVWMGYERKRGKLEQFNAILRGEGREAFSDMLGDLSILSSIQYVITLDTDTQLPRDTARKLVGNMAHPLNRPVYDAVKKRVVKGYAILQPRVSISLASASRSRFARLFAGDSGIDPYTREVSDAYQDIFGEGSFLGKGIYDVDAFRLATGGCFPENLILSHDLLESSYARSALVSDVDLIEELPASYAVESSRRHRWIRGDWQLAGWLLRRVPGPAGCVGVKAKRQANPLSPLSVWKIADNLRRSLVPPALLALLAVGWLFGPGAAWLWSLAAVGVVFLPPLLRTLIELIRKPEEYSWRVQLTLMKQSAGRPMTRAMLSLLFLPYDALICLDAILRSGVRMLYTRRGLLLWHMRSYSRRNARHSVGDYFVEMWIAPALALALACVLGSDQAMAWPAWTPIAMLWLASPVAGWWLSKPLVPARLDVSSEQATFLRGAARRTWRYFTDFVGPQDNWLPPDNFQEYPAAATASRTSPTNIGLSLLSTLAAYDFGYISSGTLLRRTESTLAAMEKLERYRGHFYNWYDTRTLQPLRPQYVSAVDSGNLAACLLTLQAGLVELKDRPVLSPNAIQGLRDTFQVLVEYMPQSPPATIAQSIERLQDLLHVSARNERPRTLSEAESTLGTLHRAGEGLLASLVGDPHGDEEWHYWARTLHQQVIDLRNDLRVLIPEPRQSNDIPTLAKLLQRAAAETSPSSSARTETPAPDRYRGALERLRVINSLVQRCDRLGDMEFDFLYDSTRDLLAIGYDVGELHRDPTCYDLLASEARLTSFLLIAQGQAPQEHWFSMGRLLTSHGGDVSLISWSGSMFEYLMPQLMLPSYENTLLDQTCKAAVSRQIEYGRQRAVPWGISESCYNTTDMHHIYQYRAFGVPGLGFKRGLGEDLVIAPYASALALTVAPREACRNLQELATMGGLGSYGFYEALDYTPSRVLPGNNNAMVRAFMAHHQGMSLLSFGHVLLDRPMQRRFMSAPLTRATELLLQERVPKSGGMVYPHVPEVNAAARPPVAAAGAIMRAYATPDTRIPEVHLLSNGRYHVMATNAGGGYSRWRDLALTRWREDSTCDCWGAFIYLRDRETERYWSVAHQPTRSKADRYEATFVQARAEFRRRDQEIETHTEISVSPEDDVEIRRVTLANQSSRQRLIEVTSYAEVVLAPLNADLAHRSFSNLFVQTEILHDRQAILCTRRPRSPGEKPPWMFHLMAAPGVAIDDASFETDRAKFIGRGRTTANPAALQEGNSPALLSNSAGSTLDPIVAIRRTVNLPPDESATVQIITGVAETRNAALALLEKYCDRHFVERAFEMAWFQSQEVLRHLNANEADAQIFGHLASSVIFSSDLHRAAPSLIARNRLGQSGLWRFGISGDMPIVLIRIDGPERIDLVKQMLQAHAYWRMKGLAADLVIMNEDFSGYRAVLQDEIVRLINSGSEAQVVDKPGGVFLRRADELSETDRVLFQAVARVVLTDIVETSVEPPERRQSARPGAYHLAPQERQTAGQVHPLLERERIFFNGLGGFTRDGHEYVITLEPGQNTPAPWANVIASPHIGTVVTESGGGYTWVENAHEFRLTTWHDDPLSDSSSEAFYIRDDDTGVFWSPTPLPARGRSGYVCRHGFGYSVFEHFEEGISSQLTAYVAMDAPVKLVVITLRNHSGRPRRLSLAGYWELVLGEWRHTNLMHIVIETDTQSGALFARNAFSREFSDWITFAQVSELERSATGNRTEFIGRNGSLASPAAMRRKRLSGRTGASPDPCAAMLTQIDLVDGEEREIVFVFGSARNTDEARHYSQRFGGPVGARQALESVWEYWNHTLGAVQVSTPDLALDMLANGWLVYQTLSCRLWGRSGTYQSGGAYGFRDQLQDTMALIHATPWLAREQLLRCAGRQFLQGDVQHWWHPPNGQGVRTHISDDYLWLPYAACRYVFATGDTGVLEELAPFLEGRELSPTEEAYYDQPQRSTEAASLYEHCRRSIRHGLRFGAHHLPLMGSGDWNDGMNLVGAEGQGESVWLAWFLYETLHLFAGLARDRGDTEFADLCAEQSVALAAHIEAHAWDGNWYLRAYFDDGTPLGSADSKECQIDSISQSWAVISGGGNPSRARSAMAALDERLVRREAQLIQLFSPPFEVSTLEPGYIKGYAPGVRENGGQYTHAAIWAAMAFAMMGDEDRAWELYAMLNPINHGLQLKDAERYKVEPYVMCADIYSTPPHTGRGGWTWYTGAAGWMYRLIVEEFLGLRLEVDRLRIAPCVPAHWKSYVVHYRYRETVYHITVNRVGETTEQLLRVTLDGVAVPSPDIKDIARPQGLLPLVDDHQEHHVEVALS